MATASAAATPGVGRGHEATIVPFSFPIPILSPLLLLLLFSRSPPAGNAGATIALKTSRARAVLPAASAASTSAAAAAGADSGAKPSLERAAWASSAEEVDEAVEARTWERRARRSASGEEEGEEEEEEVEAVSPVAVVRLSSEEAAARRRAALLCFVPVVGITTGLLLAVERLGSVIAEARQGAAALGIPDKAAAADVVSVGRIFSIAFFLFLFPRSRCL